MLILRIFNDNTFFLSLSLFLCLFTAYGIFFCICKKRKYYTFEAYDFEMIIAHYRLLVCVLRKNLHFFRQPKRDYCFFNPIDMNTLFLFP